jgi:hypothetical protein
MISRSIWIACTHITIYVTSLDSNLHRACSPKADFCYLSTVAVTKESNQSLHFRIIYRLLSTHKMHFINKYIRRLP